MSTIKADRFTALKAKVKAEMLRRNQSGSVSAYGGSGYDYTETPAAGKTVMKEHRDKLIEPMRAVNSDVIPAGQGVISETELANLETRAAVWAARSITDTSGSDCKSGCTGACYGGCATGCSGCSGCSGCGSGCASGCSGCGSGCPNGCSGCGSGCPSGCSSCGGACASGCNGCGGCSTACNEACASGCSGGCGTNCRDSCERGGN